MIENVISTEAREARSIPAYSLIQIWDAGLSTTRVVMCKGHTATWSVFAYDNGYTFRVRGGDMLTVVNGIQNWANISDDDRMEIELQLMTKGL